MEKTYVEVEYSEREEAKKCGARWDSIGKRWYATGNVELFLLKFTGRTKLQRDLLRLREDLDDTFRSIKHNENADITIYCPKRHKCLVKELDELKKRIEIVEKQVKEDYNVQHYINLLELDQDKIQTKKKSNGVFSKSDFF